MEAKFLQRQRGRQIEQGLLAAALRLTPEQRLDAFLTHSRLLMELYLAGQRARDARHPPSK